MESLPSNDLKATRSFIQKFSMIVGIEMPDGKKFHPRYIFAHIIYTVTGIMHLNGIYKTWPNFNKLCLSFAFYSLIVQLLARLVNQFILNDEQRINELKNFVINFYKQEEIYPKLLPSLKSGAEKTKFIIQSYLPLSFVVYHIPIIASWITSYKNGTFEMFAQLQLPLLGNDNLTNYMINSFFILTLSTIIYLAFMIQDMTFIFHSSQTVPMADVIVCKLQILSEKLKNIRKSTEESFSKIMTGSNKQLKNQQIAKYLDTNEILSSTENELYGIIIEHMKFNDYIKQMITSYQCTAFVALSFNSIALGLSIVSVRFVSIPIGSAVSLILLFQVLLPCANGQLIFEQNEKILNAVYEFPWYELSLKKRKIFHQFLLVCQHTRKLHLPIIGYVGMEIFTNFLNASYSYFMLLIKFVKH